MYEGYCMTIYKNNIHIFGRMYNSISFKKHLIIKLKDYSFAIVYKFIQNSIPLYYKKLRDIAQIICNYYFE